MKKGWKCNLFLVALFLVPNYLIAQENGVPSLATDTVRWSISVVDVIGDDGAMGIGIEELEEKQVIIEERTNKVYTSVDQWPTFPGGESEIYQFIKDNLNYPKNAKEMGVQGRVVIRFVVEANGEVSNAQVMRGIDSACDKEAIRLVESMPKWNPGIRDGVEVATYFTLPILFRIEREVYEMTLSQEEFDETAQRDTIIYDGKISIVGFDDEVEREQIYEKVDQLPQFPGGDEAMQKYITANLKYPRMAHINGVEGDVFVHFMVDANGEVSQAGVVAGIGDSAAEVGFGPGCDDEALRLVKSMPKWKPAIKDGVEVATYYTLLIPFHIEKEGSYDEDGDIVELKDYPQAVEIKEEKPYLSVEQMPSYVGGDDALRDYLKESLNYPKSAEDNGIQGRVVIRFVVQTNGEIGNIEIVRGIDPACDKEAIRLIESMPKWNPGKQNGDVVPVYYTIPIIFRIKN